MSIAGFRPGSRATFVSAKVAKTIDAQSGFSARGGRKSCGADQLATLKQGPSVHIRAPTKETGKQASV